MELNPNQIIEEDQALTAKQDLFVKGYLSHFNATKAAKEAGYSEKTARQQGSENLAKPVIKKIIKEYLESKAPDERVINELARIGFSDITDVLTQDGTLKELNKLTQDESACISEITETGNGDTKRKTLKFHNKLQALSKLADIKGMVKSKIEHTGEGGAPLNIQINFIKGK